MICWSMLPYGRWNGLALNYILHVTDITPDFSQSFEFYQQPFNHSCLKILNLTVSCFLDRGIDAQIGRWMDRLDRGDFKSQRVILVFILC